MLKLVGTWDLSNQQNEREEISIADAAFSVFVNVNWKGKQKYYKERVLVPSPTIFSEKKNIVIISGPLPVHLL